MTSSVPDKRSSKSTSQTKTDLLPFGLSVEISRVERFGIGQKKSNNHFLDVLELTFASIYLVSEQKIPMLPEQ
jgi:hypothetical protein